MRLRLLLALAILVPAATADPILDNPEAWDTVLYVHPGGFGEGVLSPEPVPAAVRLPSAPQAVTACQDGLLTATWALDPASSVAQYTRRAGRWDAGMYGNAPLADVTVEAGTLELDWFVQLNGTVAGLQDTVLTARLLDRDSVHDEARRGGAAATPYATASTQPADLDPTLSGHPDVTVHDVDGTTVYGFHLAFPLDGPLTVGHMRSDLPDAGHGYHLQVRVQGDDGVCRTGAVFGREISLHSSPDLRAQMRYTEAGPRWIEAMVPFADEGTIGVRAALAHPYGSGGLWIPTSSAMRMAGPADLPVASYRTTGSHGTPLDPEGERWPIDHTHGDPGSVTQTWSLQDAPRGTYIVNWTVQDNLRQASATATAVFVVDGGQVSTCTLERGATVCRTLSGPSQEDAPGSGAVAVLFALAGLAAWRRR